MPTSLPCRKSSGKATALIRHRASLFVAMLIGAVLAAPAARATAVTDPTGDFLNGTFNGPHNADLDVVSAEATYDGNFIHLRATMDGKVGTTGNGLYVWGIDRGKGTEILANKPNPVGVGVKFDSIVVLKPDGTGFVVLVNPDGTPAAAPVPLDAGAVTIDGNTISAVVKRADLPSSGAEIGDYGFNIWPRIDGISSNDQVSDFAPGDTDFRATAVSEPSAWPLMIAGLGLVAATLRRRCIQAT